MSDNVDLNRRIAELEKRLSTVEADLRSGVRRPRRGYNADGTMRCPYADIPGERPCAYHTYSGCRS